MARTDRHCSRPASPLGAPWRGQRPIEPWGIVAWVVPEAEIRQPEAARTVQPSLARRCRSRPPGTSRSPGLLTGDPHRHAGLRASTNRNAPRAWKPRGRQTVGFAGYALRRRLYAPRPTKAEPSNASVEASGT